MPTSRFDPVLSGRYRLDEEVSADEADLPYSVKSVLVLVQIQDHKLEDDSVGRLMTVRSIATIELKEKNNGRDWLFEKHFYKKASKRLEHWKGNAREVVGTIGPGHSGTHVYINGDAGKLKTIVFGANIYSELPYSRRSIQNAFELGPDQAWWGYPNQHEHTIGEVTIIVDSHTTPLRFLDETPTFRRLGDGTLVTFDVEFSPEKSKSPGEGGIWARWQNVKPKEVVGVRYTWM